MFLSFTVFLLTTVINSGLLGAQEVERQREIDSQTDKNCEIQEKNVYRITAWGTGPMKMIAYIYMDMEVKILFHQWDTRR